jgi:hypothetical protein
MFLALEKYKVGDAVNVTTLRDGPHGADKGHLGPGAVGFFCFSLFPASLFTLAWLSSRS